MSAAAVRGVTHTLRTRVDGTLSITIEVEPNQAKTAFSIFGEPGTAVALAALSTQQVAKDYGQHYAALYKMGWWHNPKVIAAFSVDPSLPPEERTNAIKEFIYLKTGSDSLREVEPTRFRALCEECGIRDTLPIAFDF